MLLGLGGSDNETRGHRTGRPAASLALGLGGYDVVAHNDGHASAFAIQSNAGLALVSASNADLMLVLRTLFLPNVRGERLWVIPLSLGLRW